MAMVSGYRRHMRTERLVHGAGVVMVRDDIQKGSRMMDKARANYNAIYNKTLTASTPSIPVTKVPADGDDYTWQDTNNPVATNTATLESTGYYHYGCRDGHHFWLYGSGTTGGQPFVGTPCMCGQKKWGQTAHAYCPSPDDVIDYGQYTQDGDDYTWDEDTLSQDTMLASESSLRKIWDEPNEESTQPWQENIMERLARLEAELAEVREYVEELAEQPYDERIAVLSDTVVSLKRELAEMKRRYEGEL